MTRPPLNAELTIGQKSNVFLLRISTCYNKANTLGSYLRSGAAIYFGCFIARKQQAQTTVHKQGYAVGELTNSILELRGLLPALFDITFRENTHAGKGRPSG